MRVNINYHFMCSLWVSTNPPVLGARYRRLFGNLDSMKFYWYEPLAWDDSPSRHFPNSALASFINL